MMKKCLLAAVGMAAWIGFGAVEVGGLPPWEFVDTEVSTNVPFALPEKDARHLLLELELAGTPSNNVQAAFGRDANTNGVLEAAETGLELGWDCGKWKVREGLRGLRGLRELREYEWCAEEVTTNRVKKLSLDMFILKAKPKRISAVENGVPLNWQLPVPLPRALYDKSWDTLRLTVRGVDRADESLRAQVQVGGMCLFIR